MEGLYKKFSNLISPLDTPLLEVIIKKCKENFKDKKDIAMLEIGAGNGIHSMVIVNGLAEDHVVTYTGIDVSEKQREAFVKNSKSFADGVTVLGYTISPWQEYEDEKKYDLILAQHSWYGIGGAQKYIIKLLDALNDGGVAFVMLSSIETISLFVWEKQGMELFSSEDFGETLAKAGVVFEKIREQSDIYTREDFYSEGILTEKGKDLCGYLYRKELSGDEQDIVELLRSAPEEAFRYPKDLFIIRKNENSSPGE